MSAATIDLWTNDIAVKRSTPLSILRVQAALLEPKTNGILNAKIQTTTLEDKVEHSFLVFAPMLDNYSASILIARHKSMLVYPVAVFSEGLVEFDRDKIGSLWHDAYTEAEFIETLRFALRSDHVRGILDSLIAQSNEATEATGSSNG